MCSYQDRDLDVQIRIDNLQAVQGYKYPVSWYETLTDRQIKAMHTEALVKYSSNLQSQMENITN